MPRRRQLGKLPTIRFQLLQNDLGRQLVDLAHRCDALHYRRGYVHGARIFDESSVERLHHIERLFQRDHDIDDALAVSKELACARGELAWR